MPSRSHSRTTLLLLLAQPFLPSRYRESIPAQSSLSLARTQSPSPCCCPSGFHSDCLSCNAGCRNFRLGISQIRRTLCPPATPLLSFFFFALSLSPRSGDPMPRCALAETLSLCLSSSFPLSPSSSDTTPRCAQSPFSPSLFLSLSPPFPLSPKFGDSHLDVPSQNPRFFVHSSLSLSPRSGDPMPKCAPAETLSLSLSSSFPLSPSSGDATPKCAQSPFSPPLFLSLSSLPSLSQIWRLPPRCA